MTLKNITEKCKTLSSFGLSAISGRAILFTQLWKNGAVFYRLPISAFIQKNFNPKNVPIRRLDELELWNSFSYYPAVTHWSLLGPSNGKYIGKDKKWHHGKYYLLLTLHIPRVIFSTLIIQKFRTNTSAHT
jgi:hypothetical protein